MGQLQADNAHLRKSLRELQQKFKALEHQRKKRGQFPSTMREKVQATRVSGGGGGGGGYNRGGDSMIGGAGGGDLYGLRAPLQ